MTIQQLIYFLRTAERGSFNAAARSLHCSQPAVAEQVRRLEAELGVTLFVREGRGLGLTQAGKTFRGHAERVTTAAEDAAASVGRRSFSRGEVVTLGTFRNAPYYLVADLIAAFHENDPEVRLRLVGQNSAETAQAVRDGELEAGLVVLPVRDAGLDVRPLFRDDVLLVSADPSHTSAPATITRLAESPLVLYDARHGFDDPTRRQLIARAQHQGVVLEPRFDVEHVETALQLCARGLGDTIAARAVTLADACPPNLTAVGFAEPLFDTFSLITREGATLSPGTRRLLSTVDSWAAGMGERLGEAAERPGQRGAGGAAAATAP